jgi:hypothetical protein
MTMDDQPTSPAVSPKPRRRWLRISLRTFLLLITVFCVWIGVLANRAREQKLAVEKLKQLGTVHVSYTDEFDGMLVIKEPARFKWLTDLLGRDLFYSVNSFHIKGGSISNNDMIHFKALPHLVMLSFADCKGVTDDGLKHLAQLTKLRQFSLDGSNINGSGFRYLSQLKSLKVLGMMRTDLNDEGAKNLSLFSNLESLSLTDTQITDEGLKSLESSTSLKSVFLLRIVRDPSGTMSVRHVEGQFTTDGIARLKAKLPGCKIQY